MHSVTTPRDGRQDSAQLRKLEDIVEDGGDETPSITEVNGTIARFDMVYSAELGQRVTFGPPMITRLPSFIYVAFALILVGLVVFAHAGSHNSPLYIWIVEGDRGRPLSAATLAFIVFASSVGTLIRTFMRGVIVHRDGMETRSVSALGIPRIKRLAWPQIHRIIFDLKSKRGACVMLELWDNTYEPLPAVSEPEKLAGVLHAIAQARKIQVTVM